MYAINYFIYVYICIYINIHICSIYSTYKYVWYIHIYILHLSMKWQFSYRPQTVCHLLRFMISRGLKVMYERCIHEQKRIIFLWHAAVSRRRPRIIRTTEPDNDDDNVSSLFLTRLIRNRCLARVKFVLKYAPILPSQRVELILGYNVSATFDFFAYFASAHKVSLCGFYLYFTRIELISMTFTCIWL